MGADEGIPNSAPASLAAGALRTKRIHPGKLWTRISRLDPNYFSNDPGVRYTTPGIPGGVLYLGEDSITCFWEVFWENLQSRGADLRISEKKVTERKIYVGKLKRLVDVFDASNPADLKLIGANTVGCFNGPYKICREWAELVYRTNPKFDGIRFPSARAGGGTNLALFGGRVETADIEFRPHGVELLRDPKLVRLFFKEGIGLI